MRTSHLILALPALAAAQQQFPIIDQLKGWFSKATESLSAVVASATESVAIPNPVASAAAKIAQLRVEPLTVANYKEVLQPGAATATPGIENWMVFVTGGNKTCYGVCGKAEAAWNESVALVSASPRRPHLALLDCENNGVLCHAWAVNPPQVLYMQLPQPLADQSTPATTVRFIPVNHTVITAPEIAAIHLKEKYLETEPYEGFWHPFDGPLAKYDLAIPVGYVIWGFSQVPSWVFLILVSFFSRSVMGGRAANAARGQRGASS